MNIKTLSILIPAYNEGKTIQKILERIKAVNLIEGIEKEIVIVNDASTDDTIDKVEKFKQNHPGLNILLYSQQVNQGKGAAIYRAIQECSGDYLIVQDADLEYDPQEYNSLLKPVLIDHADVVYGSRFKGSQPHRVLFFWHSIGNRMLTILSNMTTNLNLSDMETCYKLIRTPIAKTITIKEKRFGFEPEITAKLSQIPNTRFYEVGISYYGRTYDEGKKIGWRDGFRALYCIFKYGLRRSRK